MLWLVLLLAPLVVCQDDQNNDSLKSALEAISRRQRDLAASGGSYYGGGLGQYRYPEREAANELTFLAAPRDFAGDGQPENIGYGYQKSAPTGGGGVGYSAAPTKALEKMLLQYLESEEEKRSAFRERGAGRLEAARKRAGTSFRERGLAKAIAEQQEIIEQEREASEEGEKEEEYLDLLQSLWEKYKESNPEVVDIEDLTPRDVQGLLSSIADSELFDPDEVKAEAVKRQYGSGYGSGYDYYNNEGAMGGWAAGGQYKKRSKQRLDDNDNPGNFLYSLKFVSPAANREAVETLKEQDSMELPDERDEDILRIASSNYNRHEPEVWIPTYGREEPVEEVYGPNEENYQRLLMSAQNKHNLSRKRGSSVARQNYGLRPIASTELLIPERHAEKKYMYDAALKRKRYPVTKRSSDFYTSPPLLHHKGIETRKKKDVTDPKVARELNQIFSSPVAGDHSSEESAHETGTAATKQDTTTHASVIKPASNASQSSTNTTIDKEHELETVEQPITMSRVQTPLEIKKKSIDWSDYFGIDRRRKKDGNTVDDDWLLSQYYKTLAMSNNAKKRIPPQSKDKKEQPFDTRVFDADIFTRSAQKENDKRNKDPNDESRIENMDSKLRNIEDLIVNEAVKYTGAHEGTKDPKEIQEVKDKIMARLAAAYSLEKMRLALREFKSSLQAQKMSKYNAENHRSSRLNEESEDDKKNKRVAVKKEKAEEVNKEKDMKKRDENQEEEFLDGLSDIEPLSEGYMGQAPDNHEDCPLLTHILQKCRNIGSVTGDRAQLFLPLCSLHQICYLCGPEVGYPTTSACDLMFLTESDAMCMGDAACQQVARRSAITLRRSQADGSANEEQCWSNSCIARYFLTSPLPNQAR